MFQTDLSGEPDIMLKYVGGIVSWKRTGIFTNIKSNCCTQAVRCTKIDPIQSVLDAAGTDSRKMFSVISLGMDFASPSIR